jgi:hypothetical protein
VSSGIAARAVAAEVTRRSCLSAPKSASLRRRLPFLNAHSARSLPAAVASVPIRWSSFWGRPIAAGAEHCKNRG